MDRNIEFRELLHPSCTVALRKESVDRNTNAPPKEHKADVALRKESVDRNSVHEVFANFDGCRSPQGERG